MHQNRHPLAGKVITVPRGSYKGMQYEVEDWQDRCFGYGWNDPAGNGNPACFNYRQRQATDNLPMNDQCLYGKIGALGHILHASELVAEGETVPAGHSLNDEDLGQNILSVAKTMLEAATAKTKEIYGDNYERELEPTLLTASMACYAKTMAIYQHTHPQNDLEEDIIAVRNAVLAELEDLVLQDIKEGMSRAKKDD